MKEQNVTQITDKNVKPDMLTTVQLRMVREYGTDNICTEKRGIDSRDIQNAGQLAKCSAEYSRT